jgi:Ca-activated chloride channel homolog
VATFRSPQSPDAIGRQPLFSTQSDLVVLHVSIKDKKGAYVSDLTHGAFVVREDTRLQPIQFFSNQDAPVTVGLLLDSSGSMQPHRELVIAAATAFAETSNPHDEIFALGFNDDVTSVLPKDAPFTGDAKTLRSALANTVAMRGRTALFDAVSTGLDYVARGTHARKILVIVSDGGDNASRASAGDILRRTQASNVVVYTVGLVDALEREANPKVLKQIAGASGGEAFEPHNVRDVTDVLRQIARDIRHSYTIGYVPSNSDDDGTFRTIRVTVRPPAGRQVVIRTRTGYLAGRAGDDRRP